MGGMMAAAYIFAWGVLIVVGITVGFILIDVVVRIGNALGFGA